MSGHPPSTQNPAQRHSALLRPLGGQKAAVVAGSGLGDGRQEPRRWREAGRVRAEALRPSVCSLAPSRATCRTRIQRQHHSDRHGRASAPSAGPFRARVELWSGFRVWPRAGRLLGRLGFLPVSWVLRAPGGRASAVASALGAQWGLRGGAPRLPFILHPPIPRVFGGPRSLPWLPGSPPTSPGPLAGQAAAEGPRGCGVGGLPVLRGGRAGTGSFRRRAGWGEGHGPRVTHLRAEA